ncbi:MAG: tetratricopeptide repeat protein [Usitatibacteraceae bacterium]
MSERDRIYDRMDLPRLYGRGSLFDALIDKHDQGCTVFGINGDTGAGKSRVAERFAWFAANSKSGLHIEVNASEWPSDELMVAGLHSRLREVPISNEQNIEAIGNNIADRIVGSAKAIFAAAVADLVKHVCEKAENLSGVVKEIITGDNVEKGVTALIAEQEASNRRLFLKNYMQMIADLGNTVFVIIDNYEDAEPSAQALIRFLLQNKPDNWVIILVNNGEKPGQSDWTTVMAPTIELLQGAIHRVDGLDEAAVDEWICIRQPSHGEAGELIALSHGGRPLLIEQRLNAARIGGGAPAVIDLSQLNSVRRSQCSPGARAVAEILTILPLNRHIHRDWIELAARRYDVADVGAALDELQTRGEIISHGSDFGFPNASARYRWRSGMSSQQEEKVKSVWVSIYQERSTSALPMAHAGLIEVMSADIALLNSPTELTETAVRFIETGVENEALSLLDASWKSVPDTAKGGSNIIEHALLAAKTRLDLGRYQEAQEALSYLDLHAEDQLRVQADLLRLKLALRQNTYEAVWIISERIEKEAADDVSAQLDREMVVNTALRDLCDYQRIRLSVSAIQGALESTPPELQGRLSRSIARSLAKLGDVEGALDAANEAISVAVKQGDVREIGNAQLALGEAHRYAGRLTEAITAYRVGEDMARSSGNRDSQIWCVLGQACAHLQQQDAKRAQIALDVTERLVYEPGFEHPLETAHLKLLRSIAGVIEGAEVVAEDALIPYERLGIEWPKPFLQQVIATKSAVDAIPI